MDLRRTLWQLQLKAIRSDLARIGSTLLKRRVAPADVEAVREALNRRCIAENEVAARWDESERSRRESWQSRPGQTDFMSRCCANSR